MRRADQVTGVVVLMFSLAVMEGSRRLPPSMTFGPGPGFFPFWLGAVMAVLSVLLIVKASRRPAASRAAPLIPSLRALLPVLLAVGGLAAYILLLERLGFLLGTTLLSVFLLGVVEGEGWPKSVLVGVLNAVALYVIFHLLLGVSLPRNAFGF
ncbi:MAG TPA: tripartite tricarboxylate transporter TctB family protein [Candidatus Methylomirabilis sp.]|nr:tripartite tricarboxylate transporter TctB family protein [Candidatus Methylomirabilis sp.]